MIKSARVVLAATSFLTFAFGGVTALDGCSGGDAASLSTDASTSDAATTGDDGGVTPDAANDAPTGPQAVTFRYAPTWTGVKSVAVVGGFGLLTDWNAAQPFVTLTKDNTGAFTGSAMLPAGDYLYVFHVIGDASAATPDTLARYSIDPGDSAIAPCPMASPTFNANDANPCSKLSVPQAAPAAAVHVRGSVKLDGQPVAGYLVLLERNEAMSHHFFVNRATTASDGTFDVVAAAGLYRLQVLHPTYLTETDATRDPIALQALRRAISSNIPIATTDLIVRGPDVGFHDYPSFAPRDAGTLPTRFTFGVDGGPPTRLTIYGTANNGTAPSIGDPWFASPLVTTGAIEFDGGFNTKQASETGVKNGERYFWGVENSERSDAGLSWTGQSMVFPITWQ